MILVFGGSFDPPHVGHVILARDAKETLGAKKVLFVPAYRAPLKEGHQASPQDRLKMVKLAVEGKDGFAVEDYEVKKGGTSYTVDTLTYLKQKFKEPLYLLVGSDTFLRFHLWKEPHKVLELAVPVIAEREGKLEEVRKYVKEHFPHLKEGKDFILLEGRRIDLSSTEIRNRVREGKSVYAMVPEAVEKYIRERNLYRG